MEKQQLISLIQNDAERLLALVAVRGLKLPQCFIAAGFLRNLVWDYLHNKKTPLNDVDVIFYDPEDLDGKRALKAEQMLKFRYPSLNWQVKNQALMHERNGDTQYASAVDAMRHWPEKETGIGIALNNENQLSIVNAFDLTSLFEGCITYNPLRKKEVFLSRIERKNWLSIWPKLQIIH